MAKGIVRKLFLPKEGKFFPMFETMSDYLSEAAGLLAGIIDSPQPTLQEESFKEIKGIEKKCDDVAHDVFDALDVTFITPFDREDIHQLVSKMDDVLDFINAASTQIHLYQPVKLPPQFNQMVTVIIHGCEQVKIAVKELRNLKKPQKISDACVRINELENVADDIYHRIISELFTTETNAIELIKNKEILEVLELSADALEDVSDILKTIIIKSA